MMRFSNLVSSKITLVVLSITHLIVSLLGLDLLTQDWVVQWDAIVQMVGGLDLYEISYTTFNGEQFNAPNHLPVFFYLIVFLVKIFGTYPQVARVFLWICTLGLTYLVVKASNVERDTEIKIANLFLAFPVLIGINIIGVFDQMVMLLMMGGIYLGLKNWKLALIGGVIFGLGVMTKIIVILALPILLLVMLLRGKFNHILSFMMGFILVAGSIFYYFYDLYGSKFIDQAFFWQTRRSIETNTVWFYLNIEMGSMDWFWLQFSVMAIASLIFILPLRSTTDETLYISVSTYIMVFLLVSRVIYSHYVIWVLAPAIPALYVLYKDGKLKLILIWLFALLMVSVGSGISVLNRDILEANMQLQSLGALILNISLYVVFVINIIFTLHLSRKKRVETL